MSKRRVQMRADRLRAFREAFIDFSMFPWVRRALRAARRREPLGDTRKKLDRAAARHTFPTADIGQMLADIERGFLGESPRDLP